MLSAHCQCWEHGRRIYFRFGLHLGVVCAKVVQRVKLEKFYKAKNLHFVSDICTCHAILFFQFLFTAPSLPSPTFLFPASSPTKSVSFQFSARSVPVFFHPNSGPVTHGGVTKCLQMMQSPREKQVRRGTFRDNCIEGISRAITTRNFIALHHMPHDKCQNEPRSEPLFVHAPFRWFEHVS